MTSITTIIQPTTETFGVLTALIATLLGPAFSAVCPGDISLARRTATDTVDAYRPRTHTDLIAIAQIIGFGLAALGSLGLSMAGDISVSRALRLRGNANACNRSAQQNRRALNKTQADAPPPAQHQPRDQPEIPPEPEQSPATSGPEIFLHAAAEQLLAEESQDRLEQTTAEPSAPSPTQSTARTSAEKRHQQMWAIAMIKQSSEITASLPNLPQAERQDATLRAGLLSSTAHDLIYGAPVQALELGALDHITRDGKPPPPSATPARPSR
jgi:hypothetical protein